MIYNGCLSRTQTVEHEVVVEDDWITITNKWRCQQCGAYNESSYSTQDPAVFAAEGKGTNR